MRSSSGAVRTSVYIYLIPIVTIVVSVLVLHETITLVAGIGMALILTGMGFRSEKRQAKNPASLLIMPLALARLPQRACCTIDECDCGWCRRITTHSLDRRRRPPRARCPRRSADRWPSAAPTTALDRDRHLRPAGPQSSSSVPDQARLGHRSAQFGVERSLIIFRRRMSSRYRDKDMIDRFAQRHGAIEKRAASADAVRARSTAAPLDRAGGRPNAPRRLTQRSGKSLSDDR